MTETHVDKAAAATKPENNKRSAPSERTTTRTTSTTSTTSTTPIQVQVGEFFGSSGKSASKQRRWLDAIDRDALEWLNNTQRASSLLDLACELAVGAAGIRYRQSESARDELFCGGNSVLGRRGIGLGVANAANAFLELRDVDFDFERISEVHSSNVDEATEYHRFSRGAVRGRQRCALTATRLADYSGLSAKLLGAYERRRGDDREACNGAVVEHPVLLVERIEYANMYHAMTELFNAWLAAAVALGDDEFDRAQVVFVDGHAEAPTIDPAWHRALSRGAPPAHLEHWRRERCVRFARAIVPLLGERTPVVDRDWQLATSCTRSALVAAFAGHMRRAFNVAEPRASPSSVARVTLIARRDYAAHVRSSGTVRRKFVDEQQLVDAIAAACSTLSPARSRCTVQVVDFAQLSFEQQLEVAASTDIMVAAHGAALVAALFMRPNSFVIEFGDNTLLFQNLAQLANVNYMRIPSLGLSEPFIRANPSALRKAIYSILPLFRHEGKPK
jgi:prepilin-type processing-associated H-X9-DG protein